MGRSDGIRRGSRAAAFFVVPVAAVLWWSVLGGAIWSLYDGGGNLLRLNPFTVGGAVAGAVAMGVAARAEGEAERRRRAAWFGLVVGIPLVPFAAIVVLYGLAAPALGWAAFQILVVLVGAAVTAAVAVCVGARAAVRGRRELHGAV